MPRYLALLVLLFVLLVAAPVRAAEGEWAPEEIAVLEMRPMGGRTPLPRGASLDEALAADAGEWKVVEASEPGVFSARDLPGGFARATIPPEAVAEVVNEHGIALLDISAAATVWIDGRPRTGDVYGYGFVTLPVKLDAEKGSTIVITPSRRGDLRLKLHTPTSDLILREGDLTVPDFVREEADTLPASVVALNATDEPVDATLEVRHGDTVRSSQPVRLPARFAGKLVFDIPYDGGDSADVSLVLGDSTLDIAPELRARADARKRTFRSELDGSVQYYALREALGDDSTPKALVLSVHGASVEAMNQANAYASKNWAHIVCPTNRRPFGFDWEGWGRVDALEALTDAKDYFGEQRGGVDESRVYLTGHSMGGHGAWSIGSLYPDLFAAVAPSAGWLSFDTYGGGDRDPGDDRPDAPEDENMAVMYDADGLSDTRPWLANLRGRGVYILHGDADETVPARQALAIAERLGKMNVAYLMHLQPGAGHWWDNGEEPGAACVDWPAMFDLFAATRLPEMSEVREVEFITPDPAVSDTRAWATILRQREPLKISKIDLLADPHLRRFSGTTDNVSAIQLNTAPLLGEGDVTVMIDDAQITATPNEGEIVLLRDDGNWRSATMADVEPRRHTRLSEAFERRPVFVYATGDDGWAAARAKFDAEQLWYRGNATIDVLSDTDFDPADERWTSRNVVLYGNAETHGDWTALVGDRIVVNANGVMIEDEQFAASDLVLLAAIAHPSNATGVIGIIAPTSPAAARASDGLPLFVSGVHYPRLTLLQRDDGQWRLVTARR